VFLITRKEQKVYTAPNGMQPGPGGAILLWHVDDIEAAFERLKAMGAKEYEDTVDKQRKRIFGKR
jgi:hypothetical protein